MEEMQRRSGHRPRRDKGTRIMTPRDKWILQWIGEQYAIRFDHLQYLLSQQPCHRNPATAPGPNGVTQSNVNQVIVRWTKNPSWVQYERIFTNEPGWIVVTAHGLKLVGLDFMPYTLKRNPLTHIHWINCLRIDIEARYPTYQWISERKIRAEQPKRESGKKAIHIPDAQILTPDNQMIAVEVELSPKSSQEMDAILQELVQGNEVSPLPYAATWYFVSHASKENVTARRAVESARLRLPEELQERVQIIELEDIIT